jgi:hypothetical protein
MPEGVAEATQIFLRDAHILSKLLIYEDVVYLRCVINLLVAFYVIHGRKGEVLLFYSVLGTTRYR